MEYSPCHDPSRRRFLSFAGASALACWLPRPLLADKPTAPASKDQKKTHLITLSFDDGFRKSSLRTAKIYEKFKLAACINVIATAHLPDFKLPNEYHRWPVGDFGLWNELQARGHEIMPHGYKHANKRELPLAESKDLIRRCLDEFTRQLKDFDPKKSVFNFPFNASTPQLEEWLPAQVLAYRTGGPAINELPHAGQAKLTCTGHGPEGIDDHLTGEIDKLLKRPSGWLIYNTHGLDDEGWGPLALRRSRSFWSGWWRYPR